MLNPGSRLEKPEADAEVSRTPLLYRAQHCHLIVHSIALSHLCGQIANKAVDEPRLSICVERI
jgi:hypothetical protein